jgi:hypothetical protein
LQPSAEQYALKQYFVLSTDSSGLQCASDDSFNQFLSAGGLFNERAAFNARLKMIYGFKSRPSVINETVVFDKGMISGR